MTRWCSTPSSARIRCARSPRWAPCAPLGASLAPGGVLLANVVSRDGGSDVSFLRSFVATSLTVFSHVEVALATDDDHAGEDNYLVVASDGPLGLRDAIPYDADFLGPVLLD